MPKIAYFECFSGASGNMILAALLDAGLTAESLRNELDKLNLSGFELNVTRVTKHGITGTFVEVLTEESHAHRHLGHIVDILDNSRLDEKVKADAKRIFTRLAEAEARVHNTTVERIHFHEVGALDAIVDIVGAVAALRKLDVEKVVVSPFSLGTGFVNCAHGTMPVPVPATVALLKGKPTRYTDIEAELVTPTGAAILTTLGDDFGSPPDGPFEAVGYGAGSRELPIPNLLRVQLGEMAVRAAYDSDTVIQIEANIDDMNPQLFDVLFDKLYEAGALDLYITPVIMKKSRPAFLLSVLTSAERREAAIDLILRESTTIGLRWHEVRRAKAQRESYTIETIFGEMTVKVARLGGQVVNVQPEYDDCKRLAQLHPETPVKDIYQEACRQGRVMLEESR
ncbi:TIGR00299 family protein [candidate division KSB3 bacterium]|uniref:Putative nickel insertion protein n=1 Tax=candidate division KSB3 bacterium TaxID=2044937 RepID=A0A2G6E9N6_9BACT|nr:MAG: TIGR00299 family protein [candidate division KSB3 bacterium]PIE29612.1 MAG: TIGR00299 family protein [candidate division KSB3 bacterium]